MLVSARSAEAIPRDGHPHRRRRARLECADAVSRREHRDEHRRGRLARLMAGQPAQLSAAFLAATFSMGVGVFFGFSPARKASRLRPIDALRHE
jgi:hypothetical protein